VCIAANLGADWPLRVDSAAPPRWKRGSCTSKNGHALRRTPYEAADIWRAERTHSARLGSNVGLLGDGQSVIDLDTEIANRALDLGVTEQQLDGPQIAGAAIDQRGLGPPQ